MDRRRLRKRAVKRVDTLLASLHNEGDDFHVSGPGIVASDEEAVDIEQDQEHIWSSDDDCDDGQNGDDLPLNEALSDWAVQFSVSLVALTALLFILRVHHPSLPKDARTLLRTTTSYCIKNLAGGTYHYFGILKAFENAFEKIWSHIPDRHVFRLQLNVDGLPLFRSSPVQFWPILGLIRDVVRKPVVIALFCGNSKPNSLTDYVRDIVSELQELRKGFVLHGKQCFMEVTSVICDAPARCFIKGIKGHTGYSGCDKCIQTGIYLRHRMTFPEINSQRRTDLSFVLMSDEDHHITSSPLKDVGFGMVSRFPHDYMHLVCLGVVRRLFDLWFEKGPLSCRLSSHQMDTISSKLKGLIPYIPMDFARKPRGLSERARWKATELRQFLLYTGPLVLRNELCTSVYNNFMLLSVAIFMLASPSLSTAFCDFADKLLDSFVGHFSELYGPEFVTYNVHGLVHLSEDVRLHGHLDLISGFPFEDFLGKMKKMLRTPHHPLAQVIRRISERERVDNVVLQGNTELRNEHNDGPVPSAMINEVFQFKELVVCGTVVKVISEGDRCVKIGDRIVLVENILQSLGKIYIVFREYEAPMKPFFNYPLNSQALGIYVVGKLSSDLKVLEIQSDTEKYVRLPLNENFVVVPLLHTKQ